jgi:hypothetical protein
MPKDSIDCPYVINLLAAKSMDPKNSSFSEKKELLGYYKLFENNEKAQYNFCIYAINYMAYQQDTIMHPNKLLELVRKCSSLAPEKDVNLLLLNYHLAAVSYYTYHNHYAQMVSNLNAIHDLFQSKPLDEKTSFKLALYFAGYNSIDWCLELLRPFIATNKDERFLHLYLTAANQVQEDTLSAEYLEVLDRYIKIYPKQFYSWVDQEFQLLRWDEFKQRFCSFSRPK